WTSIPMRIEGNEMNESEVAVNIDISQPFTSWGNDQAQQDCATLGTVTNNTLPIYEFNTKDLKVSNYVEDQNLDNEIDLVGVVPNPYYGGNAFESDKLDHKVKITNLPENSTVTIYTVDGVLINQIKADNGRDIDWNLKNRFGISIASGMYIIHIKSPTAEKTIKWFGSLRPVDLDTF
ncbi:MAG: T9SS type A sorting domain-containing protein, partial [Flavobacteriales bacterium]